MIPPNLVSIGLGFDLKVKIFLASFPSHYHHHLSRVHLICSQYCQEVKIGICLLKLFPTLLPKASTILY